MGFISVPETQVREIPRMSRPEEPLSVSSPGVANSDAHGGPCHRNQAKDKPTESGRAVTSKFKNSQTPCRLDKT